MLLPAFLPALQLDRNNRTVNKISREVQARFGPEMPLEGLWVSPETDYLILYCYIIADIDGNSVCNQSNNFENGSQSLQVVLNANEMIKHM